MPSDSSDPYQKAYVILRLKLKSGNCDLLVLPNLHIQFPAIETFYPDEISFLVNETKSGPGAGRRRRAGAACEWERTYVRIAPYSLLILHGFHSEKAEEKSKRERERESEMEGREWESWEDYSVSRSPAHRGFYTCFSRSCYSSILQPGLNDTLSWLQREAKDFSRGWQPNEWAQRGDPRKIERRMKPQPRG